MRQIFIILFIGMFIPAIMAETNEDLQKLWSKNCASCHGKDGKGKTRAGKKAGVKDLTDVEYLKSFTDERAFKSIKEGMKNKETGKVLMKPYEKKLTDDQIKALIKFSRQWNETNS